jgi:WD40 repeat protein
LITRQKKVNSTATHEVMSTVTHEVMSAVMFKANVRVLTALTTDRLRLVMHFFHPIQQCAQQVYHTALPLSPTLSRLRNSSFTDHRMSPVTAFSGAPREWGSLLRTIDVRPRKLTCIATSAHRIVAACEDTVDIYDAVTFVLRQSLRAPETVTKIQGSPDGSILFFAHSHSVTMWDLQTGGLAHTFTTRSEITDIAVSTMGDRIAYSSSDNSVAFWNTRTKEESKGFGNGQPVVTICWLSSQELAIATQGTVYIRNITVGQSMLSVSIPGCVWGMVYLESEGEFLVGASQPGSGADRKSRFFRVKRWRTWGSQELEPLTTNPWVYLGGLLSPTLVGDEIVCITPPNGVQSFDTKSHKRINNPPLLDAATFMAVSLNRNLVAQTKDSIQIFSIDVLRSDGIRNNARSSHIYPLGEKHIACLRRTTRHLTLLELETLRELHPDGDAQTLGSLPTNQSPSARASSNRGFVAEFGVSVVTQAWQSGAPLPEWAGVYDEGTPLSVLSPDGTWFVAFYGSPRQELRVKDKKDGIVLVPPLGDGDLGSGEVYDVTFDSNTRFHLKVDGPGRHVQIPHDIIPSPSGPHSHTITKGEPVPLSEPREVPPYSLDANREWVVDAKSRKICWISPGNVRRGNGGHFWAGLSLVMVGDDGVVRKLSFREPDC